MSLLKVIPNPEARPYPVRISTTALISYLLRVDGELLRAFLARVEGGRKPRDFWACLPFPRLCFFFELLACVLAAAWATAPTVLRNRRDHEWRLKCWAGLLYGPTLLVQQSFLAVLAESHRA
jgi:hypothetical protein